MHSCPHPLLSPDRVERSSLFTSPSVTVGPFTLGRPPPGQDSIRPVWRLPLLLSRRKCHSHLWLPSPAPGAQRLWRCQLPLASLPLLVALVRLNTPFWMKCYKYIYKYRGSEMYLLTHPSASPVVNSRGRSDLFYTYTFNHLRSHNNLKQILLHQKSWILKPYPFHVLQYCI